MYVSTVYELSFTETSPLSAHGWAMCTFDYNSIQYCKWSIFNKDSLDFAEHFILAPFKGNDITIAVFQSSFQRDPFPSQETTKHLRNEDAAAFKTQATLGKSGEKG